jgi:aconitase A
MKTSKEKAISKPTKTSTTGKSVKGKKVTAIKSRPTEEEIREKAKEIYYELMARGEYGTEEDDWRDAEELLRSSME